MNIDHTEDHRQSSTHAQGVLASIPIPKKVQALSQWDILSVLQNTKYCRERGGGAITMSVLVPVRLIRMILPSVILLF